MYQRRKGFDIAESNEELTENIISFDLERYLARVNKFMNKYEVVEDGHAGERASDVIENYIKM